MATSPRRKAFGQHFLRDAHVIQKIVDAAKTELHKKDVTQMLEIGPGRGAITNPLLDIFIHHPQHKDMRFVIVEKDRKLVEEWKLKTADNPHVTLISSDFLHVNDSDFLGEKKTLVVSNLPYSAGTAILNKLAVNHKKISCMILMFQAEVAARLRASPDSKSWGSLSLWIQNHWNVEKMIAVAPSAFSPPPDVNSEVVVLTPRTQPLIPASVEHPELWEKLLKISFLHRRKMLRSSLPKNASWLQALSDAQIDPTLRAEALTWDQWKQWLDCVIKIESGLKIST